MIENEISAQVVDSAIEVHRTLGGPGLLESIYEEALALELTRHGLEVERQIAVSANLQGPGSRHIAALGSVSGEIGDRGSSGYNGGYNSIFEAQALTYLRMTGLRLALVINFGERYVKDGIHCVVNRL